MGFLMAKILGLLLVAAACGAWLSYWWFRRNYQDVTLEYTRWHQEWAAWRRDFEERLAERPEVDLRPVSQQIAAVDAAVRGIHIPVPKPTDLSPVMSAVAAIHIPSPEAVDLEPLYARLDAIEERLAGLRAQLESPAPPPAATAPEMPDVPEVPEAPEEVLEASEMPGMPGTVEMFDAAPVSIREGSRNLLSHPGHGKPDDLTRIKGVKRVVERTLHDVGVFYFWQIADWSDEDIEHLHDILPEFRGRIEREDWVEQAGELAGEPDAAAPPEVPAKEH